MSFLLSSKPLNDRFESSLTEGTGKMMVVIMWKVTEKPSRSLGTEYGILEVEVVHFNDDRGDSENRNILNTCAC